MLASAGMAVASWLAPDLMRNDFERFDDLRRSFLFFGLSGVALAAYWTAYANRDEVPSGPLRTTTIVCLAALFAAFPVGSKDVFGYAMFGKILGHYGANPLVTAPSAFPADPWLPFLGDARWRDWPVVYGALAVWQAWAIDGLAGADLWVAVWLYKGLAMGLFGATLVVAAAVLRRPALAAPASWLLALLAWNPLLQFETAGNAHNDIVMVLAVCVAVWCRQRERSRAAVAVLAVAFWYKWYSLLFLPAFLVDRAGRSWRAAGGDLGVVVAVVVGVGVLSLWPLPGPAGAVLSNWFAPKALQGIYPNELSPLLAPLFWGLNWAGAFESVWGAWTFDVMRWSAFAAAAAAITWRQWRAGPSVESMLEAGCLWAAAFVLLVLTMLLPWHLLMVIVPAVLCGREPFIGFAVVLTVLGLASYFLTFAVATLALALIAAGLWALRREGTMTAWLWR